MQTKKSIKTGFTCEKKAKIKTEKRRISSHPSNHHHGCKIKSIQHKSMNTYWIPPTSYCCFERLLFGKRFCALVNWKVYCILGSWWQQKKPLSCFKRHHLLWLSPVVFEPWIDKDIPICQNIFSNKVSQKRRLCWLTPKLIV